MLRILIYILSLFVTSCNDIYIYDRVGFGPGDRPQNYINPNYPVHIVPANNHLNQAQPKVVPNLPSHPAAASRFYSNPYAIPPSSHSKRHDSDQYYYPPIGKYNIEDLQLYQLHMELLPES